MNKQIRRLFIMIAGLFVVLGLAATNIQFVHSPELIADGRNARTILHQAELDRGPIIVGGQAVASSTRVKESNRYQRVYAQGPLYAPITGYFSSVFSQSTGMEQAASSVLDGDSQVLLAQRLRNLFAGNARKGGGVELTISPAMQQAAASALGNRKGAVVALDAKTGAVLALYSSPSFDPNTLATFNSGDANQAFAALDDDPAKPLENRAIAGNRYAPGSTFKMLTTIALLENKVAQPDTAMPSPVSVNLPGTNTPISNNESETCGNGDPTLAEAFARSCNTTFVIASQKLTHQQLADVAQRFGFGQELEIPLSVTPSVFPDQTNAAQLALSAIGQYSVQVTPLQMAMVAQAIGNGGVEMQPYLIKNVVDADLQVQSTTDPERLGQPISADIAREMTDMMKGTVDQPYGTGASMALPGVSVAAKTGTAELGDGSGRSNGWVAGFAPADDPQIAFAVLVEADDATPVAYGGSTAGPVARSVLEAGLK